MDDEKPTPSPAVPATPATPAGKPKLGVRLKALLEEYGRLALIIYFVLFGLVLTGFIVAIAAGVHVQSAAGGAGLVGAAWLATKLTQPLRILVTLALTPVVARLLARRKPSDPSPKT